VESREAAGNANPKVAESAPDAAANAGHRPIWLVGMMGVGKSTIGPILARALGRPFLDSDHEIERLAGRSVAQIFAEQGEAAFRELERQTISHAEGGNAVVALGGGAMAQPGAPDRLRASGVVVYLSASPEKLVERIAKPESRPLLAGLDREQRLQRLAELLAEREPCYRQASLVLDTDRMSMEGAAHALAEALLREGSAA
jgi:shikimate kinase